MKNQKIMKVTVVVGVIAVILLGVTFALTSITTAGTKRQVITTGELDIILDEDDAINLTNAMPVYDEVGMIGDAFNFRLINKTPISLAYTLKLVKVSTSNELSPEIVRYGLTKDGESTIDFLSTITDDIVDSGTISGNQTIEYSLRLWIDINVEDESLINGKTLSYRVDAEASEIEEQVDPILRKRESNNSKELFWSYASNITFVTFENKVNVPSTIPADQKWDASANEDKSVMAYIEPDSDGSSTYRLHIQGKGKIIANTDSNYLFSGFSKLTAIEGLEYFDTLSATSMVRMFDGCSSLTSLDVSGFDTSNVLDMSYIFLNCSTLSSLNISSFDTSNVTNMAGMFSGCSGLSSLDVSKFNTSKVKYMGAMFQSCSKLTNLNVSTFNTSNVENMVSMFEGCSRITTLNLSNFSAKNVIFTGSMFYGCSKLTTLNISNFDIASLGTAGMKNMFTNIPNNCRITVANTGSKNTVLYLNSSLTNVVVG